MKSQLPNHWKKLGQVVAPTGQLGWRQQYAHLPTPIRLGEKTIRIFFATLDENNFGRIDYFDVLADDPCTPVAENPQPISPVLDLGPPGSFDDSGVNPSCVVAVNGEQWLYYIGWQRGYRVPYMLFAGVSKLSSDATFASRLSNVPILDRTNAEPFLRSATSILSDANGYQAWYVSAQRWITVDDTPYPEYIIRHATSNDGLGWTDGTPCISLQGNEFGIGRPWVIYECGIYRMWYSIRSKTEPYRLGYAESVDGLTWQRCDDAILLHRSLQGWDSEMICYPAIIDIGKRRYIFYNGNGHGRSGFGVAEGIVP